ncbi:MAG: 5-formyltetrahydrofolate cyclo-ligase [Alphaproteobacteria bacterium]|nr:5-formyltetrahydrofolate cyclo-ligase [Alphaproteobacteria bacterium]HPF46202.1 5-formyltetrahydrofolate cyclo-ligase [Emcibacteraceae bacterium]HRW30299.1 5-formyltetrahydrofolate cyclo-ligase [Emcibacteraceae bacterium]
MFDKNSLRKASIIRRSEARAKDNGMAARMIASKVIMLPELDVIRTISGFIPINDEIDCLTVLKVLHAARFPLCLPTIRGKNEPLEFNFWDLYAPLDNGPFGTKQSTGVYVSPDVLLVPLLAFDDKGFRLGYGGGYYDRTLEKLRNENPELFAIGIAYDDQKLDSVPTESYDQPLDMVITEKTTYRFK